MSNINNSPETRDTGGTGVKKRGGIADVLILIVSVFIAFVMWLYVMSLESPSYEKIFTSIPIEILENESPLSVYYGYNNLVDVKVIGKKGDVDKLSPSDITAAVDIGGLDIAGRYTLPVNVSLPQGLSVKEQSVNTLSVYLDNRSSATVPVEAKFTSYQLAEGFEVSESDIRLSVAEINVTGPESVLETIASARADLQLGQVSSSVVVVSDLRLVDTDGKPITSSYVTMSTSSVTATVPVYMYKEIPLDVDFKYGYLNDDNSRVSISPPTVRVRGEVGVVGDFTSIKLSSIDETKLVTDSMKVSLSLPEGLTNVDGIDEATVTVTHIGTDRTELVIDSFNVINPGNLKYTLLSDSINVAVRGEEMHLLYLKPSDITATIDLSYITGVGTVSQPVSITFSDAYKNEVYAIGDYKISIKTE